MLLIWASEIVPLILLTTPLSNHAENTFRNTPLYRHAKTGYIDQASFPTMIKLALLITTLSKINFLTPPFSRHAETDFFDYACSFPVMLK
jgi:hypothetical protein